MTKRTRRKTPKRAPKAALFTGSKLVAREHSDLTRIVSDFSAEIYRVAFDSAVDEVLDGLRHSLKSKRR